MNEFLTDRYRAASQRSATTAPSACAGGVSAWTLNRALASSRRSAGRRTSCRRRARPQVRRRRFVRIRSPPLARRRLQRMRLQPRRHCWPAPIPFRATMVAVSAYGSVARPLLALLVLPAEAAPPQHHRYLIKTVVQIDINNIKLSGNTFYLILLNHQMVQSLN